MAATSSPLLEARGIAKAYRDPDGRAAPVLDLPAFDLAAGERAALIGRSGSGKTTLLQVIAGIAAPDAGSLRYRVDGGEVDLAALGEARRDRFRARHIGCVFQAHLLLPALSALDNVLLAMGFAGGRPDRAWAEHLLDAVGLSGRRRHRPGQLSLGQRQRVACARALANRPRLVLADEPTGALDAASGALVVDLLLRLAGETGAALLVVTHDDEVAARIGGIRRLDQLNRASAA